MPMPRYVNNYMLDRCTASSYTDAESGPDVSRKLGRNKGSHNITVRQTEDAKYFQIDLCTVLKYCECEMHNENNVSNTFSEQCRFLVCEQNISTSIPHLVEALALCADSQSTSSPAHIGLK